MHGLAARTQLPRAACHRRSPYSTMEALPVYDGTPGRWRHFCQQLAKSVAALSMRNRPPTFKMMFDAVTACCPVSDTSFHHWTVTNAPIVLAKHKEDTNRVGDPAYDGTGSAADPSTVPPRDAVADLLTVFLATAAKLWDEPDPHALPRFHALRVLPGEQPHQLEQRLRCIAAELPPGIATSHALCAQFINAYGAQSAFLAELVRMHTFKYGDRQDTWQLRELSLTARSITTMQTQMSQLPVNQAKAPRPDHVRKEQVADAPQTAADAADPRRLRYASAATASMHAGDARAPNAPCYLHTRADKPATHTNRECNAQQRAPSGGHGTRGPGSRVAAAYAPGPNGPRPQPASYLAKPEAPHNRAARPQQPVRAASPARAFGYKGVHCTTPNCPRPHTHSTERCPIPEYLQKIKGLGRPNNTPNRPEQRVSVAQSHASSRAPGRSVATASAHPSALSDDGWDYGAVMTMRLVCDETLSCTTSAKAFSGIRPDQPHGSASDAPCTPQSTDSCSSHCSPQTVHSSTASGAGSPASAANPALAATSSLSPYLGPSGPGLLHNAGGSLQQAAARSTGKLPYLRNSSPRTGISLGKQAYCPRLALFDTGANGLVFNAKTAPLWVMQSTVWNQRALHTASGEPPRLGRVHPDVQVTYARGTRHEVSFTMAAYVTDADPDMYHVIIGTGAMGPVGAHYRPYPSPCVTYLSPQSAQDSLTEHSLPVRLRTSKGPRAAMTLAAALPHVDSASHRQATVATAAQSQPPMNLAQQTPELGLLALACPLMEPLELQALHRDLQATQSANPAGLPRSLWETQGDLSTMRYCRTHGLGGHPSLACLGTTARQGQLSPVHVVPHDDCWLHPSAAPGTQHSNAACLAQLKLPDQRPTTSSPDWRGEEIQPQPLDPQLLAHILRAGPICSPSGKPSSALVLPAGCCAYIGPTCSEPCAQRDVVIDDNASVTLAGPAWFDHHVLPGQEVELDGPLLKTVLGIIPLRRCVKLPLAIFNPGTKIPATIWRLPHTWQGANLILGDPEIRAWGVFHFKGPSSPSPLLIRVEEHVSYTAPLLQSSDSSSPVLLMMANAPAHSQPASAYALEDALDGHSTSSGESDDGLHEREAAEWNLSRHPEASEGLPEHVINALVQVSFDHHSPGDVRSSGEDAANACNKWEYDCLKNLAPYTPALHLLASTPYGVCTSAPLDELLRRTHQLQAHRDEALVAMKLLITAMHDQLTWLREDCPGRHNWLRHRECSQQLASHTLTLTCALRGMCCMSSAPLSRKVLPEAARQLHELDHERNCIQQELPPHCRQANPATLSALQRSKQYRINDLTGDPSPALQHFQHMDKLIKHIECGSSLMGSRFQQHYASYGALPPGMQSDREQRLLSLEALGNQVSNFIEGLRLAEEYCLLPPDKYQGFPGDQYLDVAGDDITLDKPVAHHCDVLPGTSPAMMGTHLAGDPDSLWRFYQRQAHSQLMIANNRSGMAKEGAIKLLVAAAEQFQIDYAGANICCPVILSEEAASTSLQVEERITAYVEFVMRCQAAQAPLVGSAALTPDLEHDSRRFQRNELITQLAQLPVATIVRHTVNQWSHLQPGDIFINGALTLDHVQHPPDAPIPWHAPIAFAYKDAARLQGMAHSLARLQRARTLVLRICSMAPLAASKDHEQVVAAMKVSITHLKRCHAHWVLARHSPTSTIEHEDHPSVDDQVRHLEDHLLDIPAPLTAARKALYHLLDGKANPTTISAMEQSLVKLVNQTHARRLRIAAMELTLACTLLSGCDEAAPLCDYSALTAYQRLPHTSGDDRDLRGMHHPAAHLGILPAAVLLAQRALQHTWLYESSSPDVTLIHHCAALLLRHPDVLHAVPSYLQPPGEPGVFANMPYLAKVGDWMQVLEMAASRLSYDLNHQHSHCLASRWADAHKLIERLAQVRRLCTLHPLTVAIGEWEEQLSKPPHRRLLAISYGGSNAYEPPAWGTHPFVPPAQLLDIPSTHDRLMQLVSMYGSKGHLQAIGQDDVKDRQHAVHLAHYHAFSTGGPLAARRFPNPCFVGNPAAFEGQASRQPSPPSSPPWQATSAPYKHGAAGRMPRRHYSTVSIAIRTPPDSDSDEASASAGAAGPSNRGELPPSWAATRGPVSTPATEWLEMQPERSSGHAILNPEGQPSWKLYRLVDRPMPAASQAQHYVPADEPAAQPKAAQSTPSMPPAEAVRQPSPDAPSARKRALRDTSPPLELPRSHRAAGEQSMPCTHKANLPASTCNALVDAAKLPCNSHEPCNPRAPAPDRNPLPFPRMPHGASRPNATTVPAVTTCPLSSKPCPDGACSMPQDVTSDDLRDFHAHRFLSIYPCHTLVAFSFDPDGSLYPGGNSLCLTASRLHDAAATPLEYAWIIVDAAMRGCTIWDLEHCHLDASTLTDPEQALAEGHLRLVAAAYTLRDHPDRMCAPSQGAVNLQRRNEEGALVYPSAWHKVNAVSVAMLLQLSLLPSKRICQSGLKHMLLNIRARGFYVHDCITEFLRMAPLCFDADAPLLPCDTPIPQRQDASLSRNKFGGSPSAPPARTMAATLTTTPGSQQRLQDRFEHAASRHAALAASTASAASKAPKPAATKGGAARTPKPARPIRGRAEDAACSSPPEAGQSPHRHIDESAPHAATMPLPPMPSTTCIAPQRLPAILGQPTASAPVAHLIQADETLLTIPHASDCHAPGGTCNPMPHEGQPSWLQASAHSYDLHDGSSDDSHASEPHSDSDGVDCCVIGTYHPAMPLDFVAEGLVEEADTCDRFQRTPAGWLRCARDDATPEQIELIHAVVRKHDAVFARSLHDLPGYSGQLGDMPIDLIDPDKLMLQAKRRYSQAEQEVQDEKCNELKDASIIIPSISAHYALNTTMPGKKDADGNWTDRRFCVDARPLNENTVPDPYMPPLPEDLFNRIGACAWLTKLDLRAAFHQIKLRPQDQAKTSFWWGNEKWQYVRMFYGMRNATAWFQKTMDFHCQQAGLTSFCLVFVDDCLVYSPTPEAHAEHLEKVFSMLQRITLRVHPDKTIVAADVVEFLGHMVSAHGMTPTEARVASMQALQPPRSATECRSLYGLFNFYRCYVEGFAAVSKPISDLLRKDVVWNASTWRPECEVALQAIKDALATPGRGLRRLDTIKPILLYTDWSNHGIGAVLGQAEEDGTESLCACVSRSLNVHEANYTSYKGEMLAVVWACKVLRPYLHGRKFHLITDHQPLKWLMTNKNVTGQYARWCMILQEFDFEVHHRAGEAHQNADALSRLPALSSADATGSRLDHDSDPRPPEPVFSEEAPPGGAARLYQSSRIQQHMNAKPAALAIMAACASAEYAQLQQQTVCVSHAADHTPTTDDMLLGNLGVPADKVMALGEWVQSPLLRQDLEWVRHIATQLVHHSRAELGVLPAEQPIPLDFRPATIAGAHAHVATISTSIVGRSFWPRAAHGITLYEPFGGICAGLEMCLRNGVQVTRYLYSDINPTARTVAAHRCATLSHAYADQFPPGAWDDAFTALPQNVKSIHSADLISAGGLTKPWFIVAGWECQDLSSAGSGQGLDGTHSSTFHDLVRIVGCLQRLQPLHPPAYLLENAPMQHNHAHPKVRDHDFPLICDTIGKPVLLDAAQFGARAHRLRNFWTNLASTQQLQLVLDTFERPAVSIQDILPMHLVPKIATRPEPYPWYPCNIPGEPIHVLPTFVAYPQSHNFCPGKSGSLRDLSRPPTEMEPTVPIREACLGYDVGATDAPGISLRQRHELTGRCMDQQCLQHLLAAALALHRARLTPPWHPSGGGDEPAPTHPPVRRLGGGSDTAKHDTPCRALSRVLCQHAHYATTPQWSELFAEPEAHNLPSLEVTLAAITTRRQKRLSQTPLPSDTLPHGQDAAEETLPTERHAPRREPHNTDEIQPHPEAAEATDAAVDEPVDTHTAPAPADPDQHEAEDAEATATFLDIHMDTNCMHYLRHMSLAHAVDGRELRRVQRRSKGYQLQGERLRRIMPDGTTRRCPAPAEREAVVSSAHENGHLGVRRTLALLRLGFWWNDMIEDVRKYVGNCKHCDRVNRTTTPAQPHLSPLPIRGPFYRWGIDLAGPLPKSAVGNTYVLVAIEHFSKHIELMPIPDKKAGTTTRCLLDIIARFGAPAEVLTDQGTEFLGPFELLLQRCYIDHRSTSASHPQSNGAAERIVQVVKRALRKHVEQADTTADWDEWLPWLALGYRCSPQKSTGFSPYYMLHGVNPVVPPSIMERFEGALDFENPAHVDDVMLRRAAAIQDACATAGNNLAIAQHRDTLRYARTRSGSHTGAVIKPFVAGDYVYIRRITPRNTLQVQALPDVWRIMEMLESGSAMLRNHLGRSKQENASRLIPCHRTDLDPIVDPRLVGRPDGVSCQTCGGTNDPGELVPCARCDIWMHTHCADPVLTRFPMESWLCASCDRTKGKGRRKPAAQEELQGALFPTKDQRIRDQEAAALHGRNVLKAFRDPITGRKGNYLGVASYLGPRARPYYFFVKYEDDDEETMTTTELKKWLLPDQKETIVAATASIPTTGLSLPLDVDFSTAQAVINVLERLLPGEHDPRWAAQLSRCIREPPTGMPIAPAEVEVLLTALDFSRCATILDPWTGDSSLAVVFDKWQLSVVTNDVQEANLADHHLDALQPRTYLELQQKHGSLDAIVFSTWFKLLDLAVPLATLFAAEVVCAHVPGHYITDATAPRLAWLSALRAAGRLSVIMGLPRGALGRRCMWLCVFRSSEARKRIIRFVDAPLALMLA